MHSIYNIKKKQKAEAEAIRIASRSMAADPGHHQLKTHQLANRYESRVDTWLRETADSPPPRLSPPQSVHHHRFRDRSPDQEIAHASISPQRYVPEAMRIAQSVEFNGGPTDTWAPAPISVFRLRDKEKEIGGAFRYRARNSQERIDEFVAQNLCAERPPWSRKDHPSHHTERPRSPERWVAGDGKNFDLGPAKPDAFPHNFVGSEAPYGVAFGTKPDDFRKRDPDSELGGEFHNIVPGYFSDSTPGKWEMSPELPRPAESQRIAKRISSPTSPSSASRQTSPDRLDSLMPNHSVSVFPSNTKRVCGGRVVSPKSYWKASSQISNPAPPAVDRYHSNSERAFGSHGERTQTATVLLLDHKNLNSTASSSKSKTRAAAASTALDGA